MSESQLLHEKSPCGSLWEIQGSEVKDKDITAFLVISHNLVTIADQLVPIISFGIFRETYILFALN